MKAWSARTQTRAQPPGALAEALLAAALALAQAVALQSPTQHATMRSLACHLIFLSSLLYLHLCNDVDNTSSQKSLDVEANEWWGHDEQATVFPKCNDSSQCL